MNYNFMEVFTVVVRNTNPTIYRAVVFCTKGESRICPPQYYLTVLMSLEKQSVTGDSCNVAFYCYSCGCFEIAVINSALAGRNSNLPQQKQCVFGILQDIKNEKS